VQTYAARTQLKLILFCSGLSALDGWL